MTDMLPVALAVALAVPSAALILRDGRDRLMRDRLRDRVVVTLKTKVSFQGVLYEVDGRTLVLRDAEALEATDTGLRLPVDGELVLARSDVEYIQCP